MSTATGAPQHRCPAASWQCTGWELDPRHPLIEFGVKHMMFTTVEGRFTGVRNERGRPNAALRRDTGIDNEHRDANQDRLARLA